MRPFPFRHCQKTGKTEQGKFPADSNFALTRKSVNAIISFVVTTWGYSSAGRALAWHARGQEFDPPYLHHKEYDNHAVYEPRGYFFCLRTHKDVGV